MRRILTVALSAAVLAAVPAAALAADHDTAAVRVVHAVPGIDVDVWVNGEPGPDALLGFSPGEVAGPLDLPAGDYTIEVFPAGSDYAAGEAPISLDATLSAGQDLTLVAHLDAAGEIAPSLAVFANDTSAIAAGEARVEVRHTAAAGSVTLSSGGTELGSISLGEVFAADVAAGELPVTVTLDETGDELLSATLELDAGTATILHAYLDDSGFSVLPVVITGLGTDGAVDTPTHNDAGEAGLATDALPAWVLGLMALGSLGIVAPTVATVRRRG